MPRTTRSQSKKSASSLSDQPISLSQSQIQPDSSTVTHTALLDSDPVEVSVPPATRARNLRPRGVRGRTSSTARPLSVSSSTSSASSLTRRRSRAAAPTRGGSRSGGRSRASSASIVGGGLDERAMIDIAPPTAERRQVDVPQSTTEDTTTAGCSDQPVASTSPPRPDWRNWESSDNEEGLDQLDADEEDEEDEESQVARHLEPTASSSSHFGTPQQHQTSPSTTNTVTSSVPSSQITPVAVMNDDDDTPCSLTPINVTTASSPSTAPLQLDLQTTAALTSTSTTTTSEVNHPSTSSNAAPRPSPTPLNTSPSSSWRTAQTPASPVTSASLQKIINDVNVEPNVSGRRSSTSTTTATASLPSTTGGSKRKREGSPDIEIVEISSLPPSTKKRDKGKGKARAFSLSPSPPTLPQQQPQKSNAEEPLSEYTCPICFFPPSNATLTPCGHVCCGSCLFTAIKTTMQRGVSMGVGENVARCPVCRAAIPGWDGRGGGVVGIKVRQIISL